MFGCGSDRFGTKSLELAGKQQFLIKSFIQLESEMVSVVDKAFIIRNIMYAIRKKRVKFDERFLATSINLMAEAEQLINMMWPVFEGYLRVNRLFWSICRLTAPTDHEIWLANINLCARKLSNENRKKFTRVFKRLTKAANKISLQYDLFKDSLERQVLDFSAHDVYFIFKRKYGETDEDILKIFDVKSKDWKGSRMN